MPPKRFILGDGGYDASDEGDEWPPEGTCLAEVVWVDKACDRVVPPLVSFRNGGVREGRDVAILSGLGKEVDGVTRLRDDGRTLYRAAMARHRYYGCVDEEGRPHGPGVMFYNWEMGDPLRWSKYVHPECCFKGEWNHGAMGNRGMLLAVPVEPREYAHYRRTTIRHRPAFLRVGRPTDGDEDVRPLIPASEKSAMALAERAAAAAGLVEYEAPQIESSSEDEDELFPNGVPPEWWWQNSQGEEPPPPGEEVAA